MSEPAKGISRADVGHLAGLARIDLSEAELDHLAAELPAILEHVAVVQQAAGDDVEAMSHPVPVNNVFREDVAVNRRDAVELGLGGLDARDLLAGQLAGELSSAEPGQVGHV